MVLRKIYSHKQPVAHTAGFTLIEVIVVVAIMGVVLGASLFFTSSQFKRESLHSERRLLVTALQTARSNAMNNVRQTAHGVALYPDGFNGYVIFSGSSYASRLVGTETKLSSQYPVVLGSGTPHEIVFSQLSGDASYDGEIILIDLSSHSSTSVNINYAGKIGW